MNIDKTLIVNLFAGPGAGKSTCMAGVFSELKLHGINCEMAPEYIKNKIWENSLEICKDQIYIFGKQLHSIRKLLGKVDVIITDSPILLSLIYSSNESEEFNRLVVAEFKRYNSLNYFLSRQKKYNSAGRCHTEEQAKEKDKEIEKLLHENNIIFSSKRSCKQTITEIVNEIEKVLNI